MSRSVVLLCASLAGALCLVLGAFGLFLACSHVVRGLAWGWVALDLVAASVLLTLARVAWGCGRDVTG